MKQEVKENWVKALRSGEFSQAREVMQNQNGYCCLGVLCKISGFESCGESFVDPEGREIDAEFYEPQQEYFGLSKAHHDQLIRMNDELCYDFSQIADYIEKSITTK